MGLAIEGSGVLREPESLICRRRLCPAGAVQQLPCDNVGGHMAIAIQVISSHPLLTRAVEEILADVKEYPVLPSASNEAEATSQTDFPRLFLLDACSLNTDLGPLAQRCRSRLPGSNFLALVPPAGRNYADEIRLFYWGIDGFVKLSETWRTELPQTIRGILN